MPSRSMTIPQARGITSYNATILAGLNSSSFVVSEASEGTSRSALLETTDSDLTWRALANPCSGMPTEQLLTPSPRRWLLNCFLDMGMSQGNRMNWTSDNEGAPWTILASGFFRGKNVGNIGGGSSTLYFSGYGRVIYGALNNPASGAAYSTDGGAHWIRANAMLNTGGSQEIVLTFGPEDAIFGVLGAAFYRTFNESMWHFCRHRRPAPTSVTRSAPVSTSWCSSPRRRRRSSARRGLWYSPTMERRTATSTANPTCRRSGSTAHTGRTTGHALAVQSGTTQLRDLGRTRWKAQPRD